MPVLDEYVVWYGKLMKSYFEGVPIRDPAPTVFLVWLEKAKEEKKVDALMVERVSRIHKDMVEAADAFILKSGIRENAPVKEYDELSRHYEEFIQTMRRFELDYVTENSGFDEKTGLRAVKFLKSDFAREMERRARRGNPFSLALVKINKFDDIWKEDEERLRRIIHQISAQVKECLRSFDDAYYLGEEFFLLALKHADMIGSQAAATRLSQGITEAHIAVPGDPSEEVSISSVVSEPLPGGALDDLLANMKKDLEGIDAKGTVVQYNELSPLQRYIHSIDKKN